MTRSESFRKTGSYVRKKKKILQECDYTCQECGFSIGEEIRNFDSRGLKEKIQDLDFPDVLYFMNKYNNIRSRILGQIQVHHIVPLSQNGGNGTSNIMVLCEECHKQVHKELDEIENKKREHVREKKGRKIKVIAKKDKRG